MHGHRLSHRGGRLLGSRRRHGFLIEAGDTIPADGEVIDGVASVDESAITGLLSAIGVAGMSRMMQANVIATLGRAVEAAGDVLLLDKTGPITLGNRQASVFLPAPGVTEAELADAAELASLADETPEGRSIVVLAKKRFNLRERDLHALGAQFVHFSAQTRMSGADLPGARSVRKGAADAIRRHVEALGGSFPAAIRTAVNELARRGSTPLVVAGLAQIAFPHAAHGSLIEQGGKAVGSELIGQPFCDPKHFWSRPSSTSPAGCWAGRRDASRFATLCVGRCLPKRSAEPC